MEEELSKALGRFKKRDVETFTAKVVSVDKEKGTCVITDEDIEYQDVLLSAVIDGNNKKFFLFPKVNSWVIVSPINEDILSLYVEQYSELESMDILIDKVNFQFDKDGFLFKKDNETLYKLMIDLISEIKKMKFTTNAGPTIQLINILQFTDIEARFKNFLKPD